MLVLVTGEYRRRGGSIGPGGGVGERGRRRGRVAEGRGEIIVNVLVVVSRRGMGSHNTGETTGGGLGGHILGPLHRGEGGSGEGVGGGHGGGGRPGAARPTALLPRVDRAAVPPPVHGRRRISRVEKCGVSTLFFCLG